MAWYLEDSARVELAVLGTGLDGQVLTPAKAQDRAVTSGTDRRENVDWLTRGDS